ncbi:MAG: hypothetical protein IJ341_01990 [Bacteroidales bacterium]|nr:hypothetical protein [Bacteroidales bacterium]
MWRAIIFLIVIIVFFILGILIACIILLSKENNNTDVAPEKTSNKCDVQKKDNCLSKIDNSTSYTDFKDIGDMDSKEYIRSKMKTQDRKYNSYKKSRRH